VTTQQNASPDPKKSATAAPSAKRAYSHKTLKVLFGLSGNKCAMPSCSNPIIKSGTGLSGELVLGQICHIYAASDDGPRGKVGLTDAEKNSSDNLVLCCPTHHVVVDGQHKDYPASTLLQWKRTQERAYRTRLSSSINSIGYSELEIAAKALMTHQAPSAYDTTVIPPQEKIKKNMLSGSVEFLLHLGAAKSREVETVLLKAAQLDPTFPERLREGFVTRYEQLIKEGYKGDDLFYSLYEWAEGEDQDQSRQAAGLCLLSHLFVICDVFEK
jgi:hypothetical protein